jgi:hypothetical protein
MAALPFGKEVKLPTGDRRLESPTAGMGMIVNTNISPENQTTVVQTVPGHFIDSVTS